jgi:hypothetical protein
MSISRRRFVAGAFAGAAALAISKNAFLAPTAQKRLTVLHLIDTPAQLETNWE